MDTGCSNPSQQWAVRYGPWLLLAALCIARALAFAARTHVVPFYPELMERLGVGYTGSGTLYSAYMLTYAITLAGAGALSDRVSPRLMLGAGLVLMAAGTFALAVVPWYWAAIAARMVQGLGTSAVYACSLKLVAVRFAREHRGRVLAAIEVVIGMGMLVTLTLFPLLAKWTSLVTLFTALAIALLAGLALLPLFPSVAISGARPGTSGAGSPLSAATPASFTSVLTRPVLILTAVSFLGLFVTNGFFGWLPTYFEVSLGLGKDGAGMLMAVLLVAEMIAAPTAGFASDKWGRRLPAIQIGGVALAIACVAALPGLGGTMAYVVAIAAGVAVGWAISPLQALATEAAGPGQAGLVTSITSAAGQAGGVLAGIVFGWIIDVTGSFRYVWLLGLILALSRIGAASLIREGTGRPAPPQEVVKA